MKYVWDTDICIYWLKGYEQIKEKVKEVGEDSINITIITLAELKFGAYNSQKVKENFVPPASLELAIAGRCRAGPWNFASCNSQRNRTL